MKHESTYKKYLQVNSKTTDGIKKKKRPSRALSPAMQPEPLNLSESFALTEFESDVGSAKFVPVQESSFDIREYRPKRYLPHLCFCNPNLVRHDFLLKELGEESLAKGTSPNERYVLLQPLSPLTQDCSSCVFLAVDMRSLQFVAVKLTSWMTVASLEEMPAENFLREAYYGLKFSEHPSFVRTRDYAWDCNFFRLVMDYVEDQEVLSFAGNCSASFVRDMMMQLVVGIQLLHLAGLCMLDISWENILVFCDSALMIDFGMATAFEVGTDGRSLPFSKGTVASAKPSCRPPEVLAGEVFRGDAVDMWCIGFVLYTLFHGQTPYECFNEHGDSLPDEVLMLNYQAFRKRGVVGTSCAHRLSTDREAAQRTVLPAVVLRTLERLLCAEKDRFNLQEFKLSMSLW